MICPVVPGGPIGSPSRLAALLGDILDMSMLIPHGACLLWKPELIWLNAISDAMVAGAFFTTAFVLGSFVWRRRRDVMFRGVFWSLAIFAAVCGVTRLLSILTLWVPAYDIEGLAKGFLALISVALTAAMLLMLPRILVLPTRIQLQQAYAALDEAVKDRPHLAQITNLMGAAAARGADLTQHLLAFARRQPLQPRSVDVNALVIEAARLLRPTLGEQVEIESMLAHDSAPALIDPSQLSTAILNLALNARDAMPNGGKLTLETKNVVLDENYAAMSSEVNPGNYVMIAVSDSGKGIPTSLLEKVFEPFYTTKDIGKGSGLGLSMVYGLVKQSNGHIRIYSEEGHGTTVKLYLPQAAGVADALPAEAGISEFVRGDESILIVEDDALVREYVVTQISRLGYDTLAANNAVEALAIINGPERIDLLFTDVIMPGGMNGRQLAIEAEMRRPGLKVLFTSGYTENAIVHHGRLDAGVLLLPKPYISSDLARMIRTALAS